MRDQRKSTWEFVATLTIIVSLVSLSCGDTGDTQDTHGSWFPRQILETEPSDGSGEGSGQAEPTALPDEALRQLPEELIGTYRLVSAGFDNATMTPEYRDQNDGVPTRADGSLQFNAEGSYLLTLVFTEDEDCRGVKQCIDGRCMLPEMLQLWERSPLCEDDEDCSSPLGCFGGRCTTHEVYVHVNGHPAP